MHTQKFWGIGIDLRKLGKKSIINEEDPIMWSKQKRFSKISHEVTTKHDKFEFQNIKYSDKFLRKYQKRMKFRS